VIALVVGGRRILGGIVLWAVLAAVLLWIVTLLHFLPVASGRDPEEALLRWWGVLARVTLLIVRRVMDKGHVGLRDLPSPVHGISEENREDDPEAGDRDGDTRGVAQSVPANGSTETNGKGQLRPG